MKIKMNWGTGITITMIAFMVFIVVLVRTSTNNTSDFLKDENYYELGQKHQDQIEIERNTLPFIDEINIELKSGQNLLIQLPDSMEITMLKAHFYRPSDGNLDQKLDLLEKLEDGNTVNMDIKSLKVGQWRLILRWQDSKGVPYYYEKQLII